MLNSRVLLTSSLFILVLSGCGEIAPVIKPVEKPKKPVEKPKQEIYNDFNEHYKFFKKEPKKNQKDIGIYQIIYQNFKEKEE